jgi:hypothetical protein
LLRSPPRIAVAALGGGRDSILTRRVVNPGVRLLPGSATALLSPGGLRHPLDRVPGNLWGRRPIPPSQLRFPRGARLLRSSRARVNPLRAARHFRAALSLPALLASAAARAWKGRAGRQSVRPPSGRDVRSTTGAAGLLPRRCFERPSRCPSLHARSTHPLTTRRLLLQESLEVPQHRSPSGVRSGQLRAVRRVLFSCLFAALRLPAAGGALTPAHRGCQPP